MKILLTTIPEEYSCALNPSSRYVLNDFIKYPPLALLSIVTNIDKRHEVVLVDAGTMPFDELIQKVINEKPDILAISSVTERFYGALKLARTVKADIPETDIIIGGPHVDIYAEETFTHKEFDFMLPGPGELAFPAFINWYEERDKRDPDDIANFYYRDKNGNVKRTISLPSKNLDGFPYPDRKRIDVSKYASLSDRRVMTTMNSSRGCPFRCTFCNAPHYYLSGSAERVVGEIEEIVALGFNEIHILDDTFNLNHKRVMEICSLIIKKNLKIRWSTRARLNPFDDEMAAAFKESGCFRLNVGVESHDDAILKSTRKGVTRKHIIEGYELIHKYGFESVAYFIIGFPEQTLESAWETRNFIRQIKPTFVLINSLVAVPFSPVYNQMVANGTFKKDHWKEYVLNPVPDFTLPTWRGEELDKAFIDMREALMKDFYLSPSFVLKETLNDIRTLRFGQLARKVDIGLKMLLGTAKS